MADTNLLRDEAERRASIVSDVQYQIEVDLGEENPESFITTTTVTFTAESGAETYLDLDAVEILDLVINGEAQTPEFGDGRLQLRDLTEKNTVEVTSRMPYSRSGVGLHRFVDPVDEQVFTYTQFEPFEAHRMFACFDQPDLKAPVAMTVVAPKGWVAVSNGACTASPDDGVDGPGRWTFAETPPISTYLVAIVAGPYVSVHSKHGDIDLGIYARPSLMEHVDDEEMFELTKQGLDWFEKAFGRPYPFGKYDQLYCPEFNFGAMENPGCVTFSERYIFRSRVTDGHRMVRANTILHEMAHMWFGDLVTMKWWGDLWLNESFATFIAHTAVDEATRFGNQSWVDFASVNKGWAYQQDQLPTTHPIVSGAPDTKTVMANFDGITYAKGASSLKQLTAWVTQEKLFAGLRNYFDKYEWSNATLDDFLTEIGEASGRDLREWSAKWLETTGVSTLRTELETDGDGVITNVVIHQEVPADHNTIRPHQIRVGLYNIDGDKLVLDEKIDVDISGEQTKLETLIGRQRPSLILLNDDDLTYAKIRLDDTSVDTLSSHLSALEDGVSRAVAWLGMWDMMRDAEIPARRFADLVIDHAGAEDDITLLRGLLDKAQACADHFGDPVNREAMRRRLGEHHRSALVDAEPDSDRQLLWANALLNTRSDSGFAKSIIAGEPGIEGLAVDPELRWLALGHLAAMGIVGEPEIADEVKRDPTDTGRRNAMTCRAARPDQDVKQTMWDSAMDTSESLHTRLAALLGFWQVEQDETLWTYATQTWVEALPTIWDGSNTEEAMAITRRLYPTAIVTEEVVSAADTALEMDLPKEARRVLLECRDETERALAAKNIDA